MPPLPTSPKIRYRPATMAPGGKRLRGTRGEWSSTRLLKPSPARSLFRAPLGGLRSLSICLPAAARPAGPTGTQVNDSTRGHVAPDTQSDAEVPGTDVSEVGG